MEPTPTTDGRGIADGPSGPPLPVIVLADDLAGALELADVATRHGLSAVVQTTFHPVAADVICVDLGIRWLTPESAARQTHEVIQQIMRAPMRWIFLRIDPVHTAQVEPMLTTVLAARPWARALVVPINPGLGQTMVGGRLHGVEHGDPAWPQVVARLLRSTTQVVLPDIATPQDLARLTARTDNATLLAGSAELFALRLVRYGTDRVTRPSTRRLRRCRLIVSDEPYDPSRAHPLQFSVNTPPALVQSVLSSCHVAMITGANARPPQAERLVRLVRDVLDQSLLDHLLLPANEIGRLVMAACGLTRLLMHRRFGDGVVEMTAEDPEHPSILFKPPTVPWPTKLCPELLRVG